MQIAKDRWGEVEIICNDIESVAEEQRLINQQSKEGHNGNRGAVTLLGKQRFRNTTKKVNARKRRAKRKQARKSRKAA